MVDQFASSEFKIVFTCMQEKERQKKEIENHIVLITTNTSPF